MAQARWSSRALREFEALIAYLRQYDRRTAKAASEDIRALSRLLARRPGLGRPGQRDGTREFSIARWHKVMVYRVGEDVIDITTLRDPRMRPKLDDTDA